MITNIFNAVKSFFDYISNFLDTFWSLFKKALSIIGIAVNYINLVLHALPAWIWVILTILLSVCILYKVLNKES